MEFIKKSDVLCIEMFFLYYNVLPQNTIWNIKRIIIKNYKIKINHCIRKTIPNEVCYNITNKNILKNEQLFVPYFDMIFDT